MRREKKKKERIKLNSSTWIACFEKLFKSIFASCSALSTLSKLPFNFFTKKNSNDESENIKT